MTDSDSSPPGWRQLLGWLVGGAGVIGTLVGLTNTEFVSALFLGVCWIPIAIMLVSRSTWQWLHWLNAVLLSLVLAAIGVAFKFQDDIWPDREAAPCCSQSPLPSAPSPSPVVENVRLGVVAPANGATEVPACLDVRFTGEWPADLAPAVAVKSEGDDRYYFESSIEPDPQAKGGHAASVTLGFNGDKGAKRFTIQLLLVPEQWRDYLAGVVEEPGATWWSTTGMPPGAYLADPVVVTRSAATVAC